MKAKVPVDIDLEMEEDFFDSLQFDPSSLLQLSSSNSQDVYHYPCISSDAKGSTKKLIIF
jgi:hypothetical protein